MKNSIKAALFSAAIVPGAGFFLLRQYLLGFLFLIPSLASLIFILRHYLVKTRDVTDQALLGEIPLQLDFMVAQVMQESDPEKIRLLSIASWIFLLSWGLSIAGSAIAGHLRDRKQ